MSTISAQTSMPAVPLHGLFIDGRETPATRPDLLDDINPATVELLAQIGHAGTIRTGDEGVALAVRRVELPHHLPRIVDGVCHHTPEVSRSPGFKIDQV